MPHRRKAINEEVSLALRSNGWWANLMGGCWSSLLGSVGMGNRAIWRPNWNVFRHGHTPSGKGKRRWSFLILAVASKICYYPGWPGSAFLQSSQKKSVFLRLCGELHLAEDRFMS